jgi:hypothetical protein
MKKINTHLNVQGINNTIWISGRFKPKNPFQVPVSDGLTGILQPKNKEILDKISIPALSLQSFRKKRRL